MPALLQITSALLQNVPALLQINPQAPHHQKDPRPHLTNLCQVNNHLPLLTMMKSRFHTGYVQTSTLINLCKLLSYQNLGKQWSILFP
ncbi:hypothetical protein BS17DRAFT_788463 [Gyrodon lividus]|nr:hypothetical protein BS17DRAFT_788463 [Gyrodon lividus]